MAWLAALNQARTPESPAGALLTSEEIDVISGTVNTSAQARTLRQFLWRWNNTMAAWQNGTLLQVEGKPGFMNYSALLARVERSRYTRRPRSESPRCLESHWRQPALQGRVGLALDGVCCVVSLQTGGQHLLSLRRVDARSI